MKKTINRNKLRIIGIFAVLALGCTACGGSSKSGSTSYESAAQTSFFAGASDDLYDAEYATEEAFEEEDWEEPAEASGRTSGSLQVQDANRKLITTVQMSAETEEFDAFTAQIEKKTKALGGYLESVQISNGRSYTWDDTDISSRVASYVIRIPASKLDDFVDLVQEHSNILDKSRNVEDVTLNYVDIQSHKKALEAERDRLLELVTQAETVEDIIALEERIATVRYEIESIESRLRVYDNRVEYSTLYLDVSEVTRYTPVEPQSAWTRMTEGFMDSVYGIGRFIREAAILLVTLLPQIILLLVIIGVIVYIVRRVSRKKQARQTAMQSAPVQQPPTQSVSEGQTPPQL